MTNVPVDIFTFIDMCGGDTAKCWSWKGTFSDKGLPYFSVDGKKKIAYREVYKLVTGDIPKGHVIRHKCDNGAAPVGCCNPSHLETGTHQDNMNDMKQRQRHGLPHSVVKAIRVLLEQGQTQEIIAHLYGIKREVVSAIATGRVYGHVRDEGNVHR